MRFSKGKTAVGTRSSFLGFRLADTVCYFTTSPSSAPRAPTSIFIRLSLK